MEGDQESSRRHHRDHSDGIERSKKRHRREEHGDDDDYKSSKKHKHRNKPRSSRSKGKRHRDDNEEQRGIKVVDASDDEHIWVEKNIDEDGQRVGSFFALCHTKLTAYVKVLATDIPTSESLALTSNASEEKGHPLPPSRPTETTLKRDEWMLLDDSSTLIPLESSAAPKRTVLNLNDESLTEDYGDTPQDRRSLGGGVDFFSSLGTEHKKKKKPEPSDPDKVRII